ncbi:MAG: hypothetical protein EOM73_15380 [Bacteroidia bacterium]|nr:hypothetical protein [Bacteroidia bacterium]
MIVSFLSVVSENLKFQGRKPLQNGVLVEVKGRWTPGNRKKHLLVRAQHPDLDIMKSDENSIPVRNGQVNAKPLIDD